LSENTVIKDIVLPFKILISPLKTFRQLAQKPDAKGLVSLSAVLLLVTAASLYASATKIDINIDGQRTSLTATNVFNGWFASSVAITILSILLYWLVFASGLALISRILGGKEISLRALFVCLAYMLSVSVVLYAVRVVVYLALPSVYFETSSSWPPVDVDAASNLFEQSWSPLFAFQFGTVFTFVAFLWLVLLGAIAVRAQREFTWGKAFAVSFAGFSITLLLLGLP